MRLLAAALTATGTLLAVVTIWLVGRRMAGKRGRHHRSPPAAVKITVVATLVTLVVGTFLGVLQAFPEGSTASTASPKGSAGAGGVHEVDITNVSPGKGISALVTVKVAKPPTSGTRYVLVARFDKPTRYKLKEVLTKEIWDKPVSVDLTGSTKGSWREFAVFAVNEVAYLKWQESLHGTTLSAIPEPGQRLTDWVGYQIPE